MQAEVVKDQEHLLASVFAIDHQGAEELNEFLVVKSTVDNHPTRLALIGHRRNHRQFLPHTTDGHRDRGLSLGA